MTRRRRAARGTGRGRLVRCNGLMPSLAGCDRWAHPEVHLLSPRRGTQLAACTFLGCPFLLEMTKSLIEVGISARYRVPSTTLFSFSFHPPLCSLHPGYLARQDCDETYSFTGPTQAVGVGGESRPGCDAPPYIVLQHHQRLNEILIRVTVKRG